MKTVYFLYYIDRVFIYYRKSFRYAGSTCSSLIIVTKVIRTPLFNTINFSKTKP